MNWLTDLDSDHSLYEVADECIEWVMESYYLIQAEQKQGEHLDD
ncbi:MAG: hypothetical protein ACR2PT_11925 [Endozoicomonas sp.]